jgi:hypothetical protein
MKDEHLRRIGYVPCALKRLAEDGLCLNQLTVPIFAHRSELLSISRKVSEIITMYLQPKYE